MQIIVASLTLQSNYQRKEIVKVEMASKKRSFSHMNNLNRLLKRGKSEFRKSQEIALRASKKSMKKAKKKFEENVMTPSLQMRKDKGLFINHVIGLIDVWVKENIMKHHVDGVWGVLISIFM